MALSREEFFRGSAILALKPQFQLASWSPSGALAALPAGLSVTESVFGAAGGAGAADTDAVAVVG